MEKDAQLSTFAWRIMEVVDHLFVFSLVQRKQHVSLSTPAHQILALVIVVCFHYLLFIFVLSCNFTTSADNTNLSGSFSTCTPTGSGTNTCSCNSGYESMAGNGTYCTPINACSKDSTLCGTNSTWSPTGPGVYSCACDSGYTSSTGKNCVLQNACDTNNGNCPGNSVCSIVSLLTVCTCKSGYYLSNNTCQRLYFDWEGRLNFIFVKYSFLRLPTWLLRGSSWNTNNGSNM